MIDEIQMIRDTGRGWAWTRALLGKAGDFYFVVDSQSFFKLSTIAQYIFCLSGLCAQEIHICGEAAAIKLVTELMYTTGEEVEVMMCLT